MKLKCLIADDEPLARKGIEKFISNIDDLELMHSCDSSVMALEILRSEPVDLLFLDIQMPGITGISLLKQLDHIPATIITTAYPNYALEGFELDVMDYLIKPIPFDRFTKAVNKAREYIRLKSAKEDVRRDEDYFFIKCENRYEKITYDELLFVEAMQNYVILHTATRKYISYLTFKSVEEYLPASRFIKVQKSFIVAFSKIDSIEGQEIKIGKHTIAISRNHKDEILKAILGNRLLKR
jgi:DNA-binding LytR/AlgR family response regulator